MFLHLLLLSLATFRISSILTNEDGPWKLLHYLRKKANVKVLQCLWCMSVWIGLLFAIFYYCCPGYATWTALPFALSTIAILVDRYSQ